MDRETVGLIADGIGIAGAVFALFAWLQTRRLKQGLDKERHRQNSEVTVVLQSDANRYVLPVNLRRGELSRAEVLGRVGMIPMHDEGKRYTLRFFSTAKFLRRVNEILDGDGDDTLTIPVRDDEWTKFDFPAD